MLPNLALMDCLASRIEKAYGLRRPRWLRGCSTSRVWHTASLRLWEAHTADPIKVPLDPELFVAAQPISTPLCDPWLELANPDSARRYRVAVSEIVEQLSAELKREIIVAEREINEGRRVGRILGSKSRHRSALGSYIVALRAGRHDLAERFAPAAAAQHRSCPLYRAASLNFILAEDYPDPELVAPHDAGVSPPSEVDLEFRRRGTYRECPN